MYKDKGFFYQYPKQQTGNSTRRRLRNQRSCRIFHCFSRGRAPPQRNLNFWIFLKKQSVMELFISIFENRSPKGSFGQNKINYEILQMSADSRYLHSGPLKSFRSIIKVDSIHVESLTNILRFHCHAINTTQKNTSETVQWKKPRNRNVIKD